MSDLNLSVDQMTGSTFSRFLDEEGLHTLEGRIDEVFARKGEGGSSFRYAYYEESPTTKAHVKDDLIKYDDDYWYVNVDTLPVGTEIVKNTHLRAADLDEGEGIWLDNAPGGDTPTPTGGGHVIVDSEGTELPQEDELQFGDGLSVVDDPVNGRTVVTVNQDLPANVVVGSTYTLGSGAHTGGTADPEFVVLDKTGDRALCISKGLYGAAWSSSLQSQLNISSYLGDLDDAISNVYLPRGNADGSAMSNAPTELYVYNGLTFVNTYSTDVLQALSQAANNAATRIGAFSDFVWIGNEKTSGANAWLSYGGRFTPGAEPYAYGIAPTFILDLTKVSLIDDVIVIKQTGQANQSDLTSIIATGSTNTTGAQITAGTYFYLNGTYCKAKTNIASNATFTLNTNYEVVTVGGELYNLNNSLPATKYYNGAINNNTEPIMCKLDNLIQYYSFNRWTNNTTRYIKVSFISGYNTGVINFSYRQQNTQQGIYECVIIEGANYAGTKSAIGILWGIDPTTTDPSTNEGQAYHVYSYYNPSDQTKHLYMPIAYGEYLLSIRTSNLTEATNPNDIVNVSVVNSLPTGLTTRTFTKFYPATQP